MTIILVLHEITCNTLVKLNKQRTQRSNIMNIYHIEEVQNQFSTREFTAIQASSLSSAKRIATKTQAFHGTWLKISNDNNVLLASKSPLNGWFNEQ